MTLPIHTAKHIQSSYNKFHIASIVFVAIAIFAALLTALSALHLQRLEDNRKESFSANTESAPGTTQSSEAEKQLYQKVQTLQSQLADEQASARELRDKIQALEKKMAAAKAPSKPPAVLPTKPIVVAPAVAPATQPAPSVVEKPMDTTESVPAPVLDPRHTDVPKVAEPVTPPDTGAETSTEQKTNTAPDPAMPQEPEKIESQLPKIQIDQTENPPDGDPAPALDEPGQVPQTEPQMHNEVQPVEKTAAPQSVNVQQGATSADSIAKMTESTSPAPAPDNAPRDNPLEKQEVLPAVQNPDPQ